MSFKYKRIFTIVIDSMGIGEMADAANFDDAGADTLGHISQSVETFEIPNFRKLGLANLKPLKQVAPVKEPLGYYFAMNERSNGKDTMTGHWEMMGINRLSHLPKQDFQRNLSQSLKKEQAER